MANVEEKILDIKVRYDDAIRAIAKYQGAVDAARLHEAELKKQLNAYHGSNPAIVSLAKRQLNMEEKNIEEMKKYL